MLASFASYALEKKVAKDPTAFGKGAIQGVAGPESANNAGAQTSFIPLLTLGIPENAVMALMVGAMTIHNIQPGPQVMTSNPDAVLGPDRVDVGRQPDAGRAEPAADRHLDQAAAGALPAPLSGDPAVLRDRRLLDQQRELRRQPDGGLRLPRRRVHEARMRARAAAARLRAGPDDGGEPAARDAALARRSRRCSSPGRISLGDAPDGGAAAAADHRARVPQEARRSVPGRRIKCAELRLGDALPIAPPADPSRATSSRRRSRSRRRPASRCSSAAATRSTRRSRPRSR